MIRTLCPGTSRCKPGGTKQAILIGLLSHPKGVTIADLEKAIGWQAHSIRGAISGGLKKKLGPRTWLGYFGLDFPGEESVTVR